MSGIRYGRIMHYPDRFEGFLDLVVRGEDNLIYKITVRCSDRQLDKMFQHWNSDEAFEIQTIFPEVRTEKLWSYAVPKGAAR